MSGTNFVIRGSIFSLVGIALVIVGLLRFHENLIKTYNTAMGVEFNRSAFDAMLRNNELAQGPKVVAIGGGTGLPVALSAWKLLTSNITAVVTVADNGGSSGRLREQMNILPPGDIRNCLISLAEAEPLMTKLMQYRFSGGELGGHSFGNLLIVALSDLTGGFENALKESKKILRVNGQVVPASLTPLELVGYTKDGTTIFGESEIPNSKKILQSVEIRPANVTANPEALRAIAQADVITIGPGSLYTSILPVLLIPGVAEAFKKSPAPKLLIANIANQTGETDGYSLKDHVKAIETHVGGKLFDVIIVNEFSGVKDENELGIDYVRGLESISGQYSIFTGDIRNKSSPWRHDPKSLSAAFKNYLASQRKHVAESAKTT